MSPLPPGAITPRHTRLLLATIQVHARDGRATMREVVDAAGYASIGSAHQALHQLRALGLLTWEDGKAATLRPLVTVVPLDRHASVT